MQERGLSQSGEDAGIGSHPTAEVPRAAEPQAWHLQREGGGGSEEPLLQPLCCCPRAAPKYPGGALGAPTGQEGTESSREESHWGHGGHGQNVAPVSQPGPSGGHREGPEVPWAGH